MRLTKRQLKRIIREEYSRLKRRGLIREAGEYVSGDGQDATCHIDMLDYPIDVDMFLDEANAMCADMGYPPCKEVASQFPDHVAIFGPKECLWAGWSATMGDDDVEFFESSCR